MDAAVRNYAIVTAGYWGFTITDGAIRMLVVLYFHQLGYSPFEVAMLFVFYEFFGIVTNLVGAWLGARIGLNRTMHMGMALQVLALAALTVPDAWLTVPWVMAAQALSGIAKDLNKMSAKASVRTLVIDPVQGSLFRWVAVLTGSKNALKGAGFFIGGALLGGLGFRGALTALALSLAVVMVITMATLPRGIGRLSSKPKFSQVFSNVPAINRLSAARLFLFAARDVWFVVALPVYLYAVLGWSFAWVGAFLAAWVIGYGLVQAAAPGLLRGRLAADGRGAVVLALMLAMATVLMALALERDLPAATVLVVGLVAFGVVFALNSAVHSYLVLAYSDADRVSMNVGFYYMANAGGRLAGTVLSGWMYQQHGLVGCLWISAGFVLVAAMVSVTLPSLPPGKKPGKTSGKTSGELPRQVPGG